VQRSREVGDKPISPTEKSKKTEGESQIDREPTSGKLEKERGFVFRRQRQRFAIKRKNAPATKKGNSRLPSKIRLPHRHGTEAHFMKQEVGRGREEKVQRHRRNIIGGKGPNRAERTESEKKEKSKNGEAGQEKVSRPKEKRNSKQQVSTFRAGQPRKPRRTKQEAQQDCREERGKVTGMDRTTKDVVKRAGSETPLTCAHVPPERASKTNKKSVGRTNKRRHQPAPPQRWKHSMRNAGSERSIHRNGRGIREVSV